jgi:hypothetical protein
LIQKEDHSLVVHQVSTAFNLTTVKPTVTKEQRVIALRSTFEPLAQLASKSEGSTKSIVDTVTRIFQDMAMEDDDDIINSVDLVGNPITLKHQKQKRLQPTAMGAPTTKASKAASLSSNKEKKQKALSQAAKALGRD